MRGLPRLVIVAMITLALTSVFATLMFRARNERDIRSTQLNNIVRDFQAPVMTRYQEQYGETLTLSENFGKPIILNFWASWCPPCREEAPLLEATWQEHQDDLLIIGINTQERSMEAAEAFLDRYGLSFPSILDENLALNMDYGLFGLPESFFIRADGTLMYKHAGELTATMLEYQIGELLQ